MNKLYLDIFEIIGKNNTYKEYKTLNIALSLGLSNKDIFENCVLFSESTLANKILELCEISVNQFYDYIVDSAFDVIEITELMFALNAGTVDQNTKKQYKIKFNSNKTSSFNIANSIIISKIILIMIEYRSGEHFVINNPYGYLHIIMINTIINYFQTTIHVSDFTLLKNLDQGNLKFNSLLFNSLWYYSNVNMYNVYLLYLLESGTIHSSYTEYIYALCKQYLKLNSTAFYDTTFYNMLDLLFIGGNHEDKLQEIMMND